MQRKNTLKSLILLGLTTILSFNSFASSEHAEEKKEFNTVDMAMHHVKDAHEVHLMGEGESAVVLPLPVIVFGSEGMAVFMSSEFHHDDHGHHIVEKGGMKFVKVHEKIWELNAGQEHAYVNADHTVENGALVSDFSITKNVATMFLVCFIMLLIFFKVAKYYKSNGAVAPRGITSWMEPLILFVRDDIAKDNIGHKYKKFMPYLLTVFFFILIGNLLGLIPFISNPNLTGNISVTLVLAFFTLIVQLIFSKKAFWAHIFTPPGVPVALYPILVPIEIAGIFIKPAALMIRLFANITAGHIIVLALVAIIFTNESIAWSGLSVPMALFISVLEILVAFLQAYIFTMLSALFIGGAVAEDHH